MFLKPVRVKSQSQTKGSDRKKTRNQLACLYPQLRDAELQQLIPNKEEMMVTKLVTHQAENIVCYSVQKEPLFFEVEGRMFPTVYTLWRHPGLLHTFTTHPNVLEKMARGAGLMLPGVVIPGEVNLNSYGSLDRDEPVAINLTTNRAPVVVGRSALSSYDMYMSGRQGKAVNVVHCMGDHLWAMGSKSAPPLLGPVGVGKQGKEESEQENKGEIKEVDNEKLVEDERTELQHQLDKLSLDTEHSSATVETHKNSDSDEECDPIQIMDNRIRHCFLKALRTSANAKKVSLPMLTSNLFKVHMVPVCPQGQTIDVKKSSYKKLSKFLEQQQKAGVISVKELTKGVQSVVSINYTHPDITGFRWDKEENGETLQPSKEAGLQQIEELYSVSAAVLGLFKHAGHSKGSVLSAAEARKVVTSYVKENNLQDLNNKSLVRMDPVLGCLLSRSEVDTVTLTWDEVMRRCLDKMTSAHRVRVAGVAGTLMGGMVGAVRKGKLDPVEITVVTRVGNKKATLIFNLNLYGIDPHEFAHQCQVGVAASTSVGVAPHRKEGCIQVMVQGNQVNYVSKLLIDQYKVPRKYIKGLEYAPKKKK